MLTDIKAELREAILTIHALRAEVDRLRAALERVSILLNGNTQLHDVFNAGKIAQEALSHD